MILLIETQSGNRQHIKVESLEDMHSVFDKYPSAYHAALSADTLEEAVNNVANYLSEHNLDAWVEGDSLTKSVKGKAAALGLALATAISPHSTVPQNMDHTPKIAQEVKKDNFGEHHLDKFLWSIKQNETSGREKFEHPVIKYGVSKGQRAMGRWGLTKPTVDEMLNRMKLKGHLTPAMAKVGDMDRDTANNFFKKNPQVELDIARYAAGHVMKRQKGHLSRAAYAWNMGHNLFPHEISQQDLANNDYVKKFHKAHKVNPLVKPEFRQIAVNKAEPIDFKEKLGKWKDRRNKNAREPLTQPSNYNPDPGRLREEALDEVPAEKGTFDSLREKVESANKRRL